MNYQDFLNAKIAEAKQIGFDVAEADISDRLKPHQKAIVQWMVSGGRRACFAAFGLGKTSIQLEAVRLTLQHAGGRGLIVCPLGVRQEFRREASERLGWAEAPRFIRSIEEADETGIYLTNYETVRDGKLDPNDFTVASLDEAAILRGFGGTKTFREFMALFAGDDRSGTRTRGIPYRYVATATPSPNEYIELLAYAAYLDVMDVAAAKTRFFKRDSTKADNLTIHPHKEHEFWLWVASWAVFVQRPSDLGAEYSDEGYDLPALDVRWHEIATDHAGARPEKDGQGRMFKNAAMGVTEASKEKRDSLGSRIEAMVRIIRDGIQGPGEEAGLLCDVPSEESRGLQASVEGLARQEQGVLQGSQPQEEVRADDSRVSGHSRRSGRRLRDLREELPSDEDACGPRSQDGDHSGHSLRSLQHGARPVRGQSRSPEGCGGVPDQQWLVWCDLNDEQRAIECALDGLGVSHASLYGAQSIDEREQLIEGWRSREKSAFVSKPVMYGAGINLQQCNRAIFVGIGYKFSDLIQAIHRVFRFGQERPVRIDLIYTEAEREVRRALEKKWAQHETMVARMGDIIREHGLSNIGAAMAAVRSMAVQRYEVSGDGYRLINGDAIEEAKGIPSNSVGLIVTSIPFSTQYEYTPSYRDLGHTDSNEHFFEHLGYLTPELMRVLQPGRIAAIHVKDRITPGGINGFGFQTVTRFSDMTCDHFEKHGFAFLGRKTIVTDVVRENNSTYRLGWTEQCKDGSRMGAGMPEYVLLFRKAPTDRSNGYADVPVVKTKEAYSRGRWQMDAHGFTRSSGNRPLSPSDLDGMTAAQIFKMFRKHSLGNVYDFERDVELAEYLDEKGMLPPTFMLLQPQSWHPDVWTDVARMRTLNMHQAHKGQEMHLCPLQFDIVDRLIVQLSNEGDTVFDPFGGLMTVPYCAIKLGRKGLATELNPRYFADGVAYVEAAVREASIPTLFDLEDLEPVA